MMQLLQQPWPWYLSGFLIAIIMLALTWFGKTFGFSSNLSTLCAIPGTGKYVSFFNFNWRDRQWNLLFAAGALIGGYLAHRYLWNGDPPLISQATISDLAILGFAPPHDMQPDELYGGAEAFTAKGFALLAAGGLLIGFGTRWAGGCTSGHAITGISNLQVPSMIAAAAFFAGGIIMTYFIFPLLFA